MLMVGTVLLKWQADIRAWIARSLEKLNREEGAEAIEWIAMAAVVVILLAAMSFVFKPGGKAIGELIINAIKMWILKMFGGA